MNLVRARRLSQKDCGKPRLRLALVLRPQDTQSVRHVRAWIDVKRLFWLICLLLMGKALVAEEMWVVEGIYTQMGQMAPPLF